VNAAHRRKLALHKRSRLEQPCSGRETCLNEGLFETPLGMLCAECEAYYKAAGRAEAREIARELWVHGWDMRDADARSLLSHEPRSSFPTNVQYWLGFWTA